MLEVLFTYIVELLIYIVSYNTGKILIVIFTFGTYSSECNIKGGKRGWIKNSIPIANVEENKKRISFNYTCIIGFLFWVVLVTMFIIVK